MSRLKFDEPAWWERPGWQIAAAAVLTLVSLPIWWAALAPVEHEPVALRTPVATPTAPQSARAPAPAEPLPAMPPLAVAPSPPSPAPPLSTMVAPGVHVTPLSVPPGTVPQPAGPSANDSEPEN
jgi:hypothetical protein